EALHGPMGIGLQAVELAPCHAGLAGQRFQRLLSVLSFVGRLLSPRPFALRLAADPRMSSASLPSAMGMLHELLRRTGRWRQSAARLGSARVVAQTSGRPPTADQESRRSRTLPPFHAAKYRASHARRTAQNTSPTNCPPRGSL